MMCLAVAVRFIHSSRTLQSKRGRYVPKAGKAGSGGDRVGQSRGPEYGRGNESRRPDDVAPRDAQRPQAATHPPRGRHLARSHRGSTYGAASGRAIEPELTLPTMPRVPRPQAPFPGTTARRQGWKETGAPSPEPIHRPEWPTEERLDESEPLWGDWPDAAANRFAPHRPYSREPLAVAARSRHLLSRPRAVTATRGAHHALRVLLTALVVVAVLGGAVTSALAITRLAASRTPSVNEHATGAPSAIRTATKTVSQTPTVFAAQDGCFQGFMCADIGTEGNSSQSYSNGMVTLKSTGLERLTPPVNQMPTPLWRSR